MIIVLPDEGRFAQVEQALNHYQVGAVLAGLDNKDVKLYLPRASVFSPGFTYALMLNSAGRRLSLLNPTILPLTHR